MSYQALPESLHIQDSPVAGQGLFAKEDIPTGTHLGMSHIVIDEIIYRIYKYVIYIYIYKNIKR